jgi:hypothetical protein
MVNIEGLLPGGCKRKINSLGSFWQSNDQLSFVHHDSGQTGEERHSQNLLVALSGLQPFPELQIPSNSELKLPTS